MPRESLVKIIPLTLAGPSYTTRSSEVVMQSTINWYPELAGTGDSKSVTLYPTPGAVLTDSSAAGKYRGSIEFKGDAYFVAGNTLYKMTGAEIITTIGTINTSTGKVSMANNGTQGDQLMFVDGTDGWIYDGTTLTQIADPDFPASPNIVVFMDTYFIVIPDNSALFWISDSNDGTGWVGTNFASAERDPDNIVTAVVNDRELILAGEDTTEIFGNTGGEFPFEPYANGLISIGCAAKHSIASSVGQTIFLAKNRQGRDRIVMVQGVSWKPISNKALEYQMSTYSKVDDAYGMMYNQAGHLFYVLTFPAENKTWVYDIDIGDPDHGWHERSSSDKEWFPGTILYFNNKIYAGHYNSPKLFTLDLDKYTEDGTVIKRERIGTHLRDNSKRLRYVKLEIDIQRGTGLIDGQGSDPKIMVDWSTDYGHTWSNVRYVDGPKLGEYHKRVLVHQMGMHRDLVVRIRVSDPINWVIKGAFLHVMEIHN